MENTFRAPHRSLLVWMILIYTLVIGVLVSIAVVSNLTGIPAASFTVDPAALTGADPLIGVISNIGVLLWIAAAAILLFSAAVLERRAAEQTWVRFVMAAGGLSLVLGFDDMFLFHESLAPRYLGTPEPLVVCAYVLAVLVWLAYFRALIWRTRYLLLALSLAFFAASVTVDLLPIDWLIRWPNLILLEDGLKLLGIVSWLAYACTVATEAMEAEPHDRTA